MNNGKFAEIVINISHENVDRPYTYAVPDDLKDKVFIGSVVNVPFGKGDTVRKGIIVDFCDETDFDESKIKPITGIEEKDVSLSDIRVRLAVWMKQNYGSTLANALKTVLPVKKKVNRAVTKVIIRNVSVETVDEEIKKTENTRKVARLRLLKAVRDEERIPKRALSEKLHISDATINNLVKDGIILLEELKKDNKNVFLTESKGLFLSDEQKAIVDAATEDLDKKRHETFLIHGITGSGKTEVYLKIVEETLRRGRQAIVLIPEIALTYQTVMRFYNRFGDRVIIMNSTLSAGEKHECIEKAQNGEADIVIGPRSALFVPFKDLGVIIIDEEHETSYKSETVPKYHARETAGELARMNNALLVLGSATPSVDAYYKAGTGEYRLFNLTKRLTGNQLPNVIVTDLRSELRNGNRTIISAALKSLLEDRLNKGEQSMLFINRRGLAGFVSCRACGFVVKCPHCDVSLSLHKNGKLICHYCGYTIDSYKTCPECGSKYISGFRAGTEQVEETVKKMFPKARTMRMDADTTKEKDSYERIISGFLDGEADILIGTQMIVKGHDFKNVTLVGVLAADMSLFEADFKAPERTFQLLTQAAGRAGRGEVPGDVVIQTYKPDNYVIMHAAAQDYEGFYEEEILYRKLMNYPPAGHMLNVLVTGKNEAEAEKLSEMMCKALRQYFDSVVIGPAPGFLSKINDVYRYVFYVKDKDYQKLVKIKDYLEEGLSKIKKRSALVFFDFDPQNMQ